MTSRHGRTLVIRTDREQKRNALNGEVTAGIDQAMNELQDDPELWAGVLTGGTNVFSAGADLASGPGEPTERGGLVGLIHRRRTKPLIAAVEGLALGGGVELVLCCDMVIAVRTAQFGLPEVKRGLMPDSAKTNAARSGSGRAGRRRIGPVEEVPVLRRRASPAPRGACRSAVRAEESRPRR